MSLESEGKEMSRLSTHIHTDRHVNIELEFCETEFAIPIKIDLACMAPATGRNREGGDGTGFSLLLSLTIHSLLM